MSYCRWSTDDGDCDLYVYEATTGPRITEGDHRLGYMTAEEGADALMGMFDLHGIA